MEILMVAVEWIKSHNTDGIKLSKYTLLHNCVILSQAKTTIIMGHTTHVCFESNNSLHFDRL